MSLTTVVPAKGKTAGSANSGPTGIERRRRRRAKISAQLRIQLTNSPAGLEEVCTTIDVSRDGLLFVGQAENLSSMDLRLRSLAPAVYAREGEHIGY